MKFNEDLKTVFIFFFGFITHKLITISAESIRRKMADTDSLKTS